MIEDNVKHDNRILIVEDESIIAMTLMEYLNGLGYHNVELALNSDTALTKFEESHFDLAILDINLNEKKRDGIDLAEELKSQNEELPIVFLTGNSDERTVNKAKRIEPDAYVVKPFNVADLRINLDLIFFQKSQKSPSYKNKQQMELFRSLFSKSPNLIMLTDMDGKIMFVNDLITRISGNSPSFYIDKAIENVGFENKFIELLSNGIQKVKEKKRNTTIEGTVETIMGERLMHVTFMLKKGNKGYGESIALLFEDITDQQIAILDLTRKNKKITDSINYSKKLQDALIANNELLEQYLPDAHILLKSKDIVGGDFPWVFKKNNYLYVAVIDCTGHGVPGALISIIFHFLLNKIGELNEPLLPSKVLEILHVHFKKTLKQHLEHVTINDGADIGMCRIDLDEQSLSYSGAHRPMLLKRDNVIQTIGGDRQPVGGVQYSKKKKRRLRFTNTTIPFLKGDSIIIFSDGLPDQFGGEGKKPRKYGIERVKEVFLQSQGSAEKITSFIETDYNKWKGRNRQIDDMILVAINA